MADPGDKDYHRRNVLLDHELALAAMDWHGGQNSMVYSLASTAYAGKLVSPSMIDAAVEELDRDLKKVDGEDDHEELGALIGELDARARFSDEFTIEEYTGEDEDDGYATWLMENPEKWSDRDPVAATATGAGVGALGGALVGLVGGPVGTVLGSAVGGAIGGHVAAPRDRKNRGAWGGGTGGFIAGPTGAALGGALGGRKPGKRNNPEVEVKRLKAKLLK